LQTALTHQLQCWTLSLDDPVLCHAMDSENIMVWNVRGLNSFFRTRMCVYFIKKRAVTYRQAKKHLAQAQRKKKKKKNEIRALN
jgi:hypothetical protein